MGFFFCLFVLFIHPVLFYIYHLLKFEWKNKCVLYILHLVFPSIFFSFLFWVVSICFLATSGTHVDLNIEMYRSLKMHVVTYCNARSDIMHSALLYRFPTCMLVQDLNRAELTVYSHGNVIYILHIHLLLLCPWTPPNKTNKQINMFSPLL